MLELSGAKVTGFLYSKGERDSERDRSPLQPEPGLSHLFSICETLSDFAVVIAACFVWMAVLSIYRRVKEELFVRTC